MSRRLSILTVCPSPHERTSTPQLDLILAELARRDDVRAALWFLREGHYGDEGGRFPRVDEPAWVVDRLRTWLPARLASAVRAERIAGGLRGWRLRRRLEDLAPDAAILDDAVGDRIFGPAQGDMVRVARLNADASLLAGLDDPLEAGVDVWLTYPGGPQPSGAGAVIEVSRHLDDSYGAPRAYGDPAVQASFREELGLPADAFVVVGWGGGGWLDGPDLFVRGLWALEHRHGVMAHGLWVTQDLDAADQARLEAEAERCGLAGRFTVAHTSIDRRHCGDVAFLPFRCHGDAFVLEALASGLPIVAFEALAWEEHGITLVPDLDLEAAAAAIAPYVGTERPERVEAARQRLDVEALVDQILVLVRRGRVR